MESKWVVVRRNGENWTPLAGEDRAGYDLMLPSPSEIATWGDCPETVIRFRCNNGHDICEWWCRTTEPKQSGPWAGVHANAATENDYVAPLINPDHPDAYWRFWLVCPRPSCNYRKKFAAAQSRFEHLLEILTPQVASALAATVPSVEVIKHPSGAVAIAAELNRLDDFEGQGRKSFPT